MWHRFLLEAVASPLLLPGAVPAHAQVIEAVRICRARYQDPLSRILPARSRNKLVRWFGHWRASWVGGRYPIVPALAAFEAYISDYHAPPEFWEESGGGAPETRGNLPDTLGVVAQLMDKGIPEVDAWEMPAGRAYWYAAAFAKLNGANLHFRTESDRMLDGLRTLKARIAAKKAAFSKGKKK